MTWSSRSERCTQTMCPWRGQGLADAHSSIPLLHWDLTIHISSLLCALYVHPRVNQANPGGSVHYGSCVCQASVWWIYRPACVSMERLLCSDGAWTTGTGLTVSCMKCANALPGAMWAQYTTVDLLTCRGLLWGWWNTQTQRSSFCSHKHVVYRSRLTVLLQYLSEIGSRYCV